MNLSRPHPLARAVVPAFRFVANLEAISWAGLLLGMVLKYGVAAQAELGADLVTLFGRLHGGLVIVYVALAMTAALRQRWRVLTVACALAATVPPFATVAFDAWAHRTGRYEPRGRTRA